MFPAVMSNSTSLSHEEASTVSSCTIIHDLVSLNPTVSTTSPQQPQKVKKKRNLPGNPDPDAEVIALSPKTLLATNRFVCEICNKGFQRDQNLQLHRRGHNLPWKLKKRNKKEIMRKRAYVCPEPTCVHHHPSRALGDLTGIKKHFCRKHGEKKWKCDKCSKIYAVQSDWKAHSKICGTREYRCDCGTLFSRKDSFITHRAFCDALAEESARLSANQWGTTKTTAAALLNSTQGHAQLFHLPPQNPPPVFSFTTHQQKQQQSQTSLNPWNPLQNPNPTLHQNLVHIKPENIHVPVPLPPPISFSPLFRKAPLPPPTHRNLHLSAAQPASNSSTSAHLSATALLQRAAAVGAQSVGQVASTLNGLDKGAGTIVLPPEYLGFTAGSLSTWKKSEDLTRDFLGLTGECGGGGDDDCCAAGGGVDVSVNVRNLLSFTGGVELAAYERDHSLLKSHGFGFAEPPASETLGNS